MKKKQIFLGFLAAGLVMSSSVGSAWAYFTTYVEARGGEVISLGDETSVTEEFSQWTKHIRITSDADSKPVYVRAKAFCSAYEIQYIDPNAADPDSEKWTPGADDYYYYSGIVEGGGETTELLVHIKDVPSEEVDQKDFNVVIIYETTPVQYDENGKPLPASEIDWNDKLDITRVEGGVE